VTFNRGHTGHVRAAFVFKIRLEKITAIELITEPQALAQLDVRIG
jgi:hypothetical protein